MAAQQDDIATIISKLIQNNPIIGLGAAALIALWWIGKNDKSEGKAKDKSIDEFSEEELVLALAKIRAKKAPVNETGRVMIELKKLVELLDEADKNGS